MSKNLWQPTISVWSHCMTVLPQPYFGHYIGGGDIMHSVCWGVWWGIEAIMVTPPSQFPLQLSCSCTALLTTPLVACTHHPRFITHGNNKTMTLMETREFVSFDKSSLGKPSNLFFGKIWEFGPTRSTPPPSPKVGTPKTKKKIDVYFAF